MNKFHRDFAESVMLRSRELARRIPKLRYSDFRLLLREVRRVEFQR